MRFVRVADEGTPGIVKSWARGFPLFDQILKRCFSDNGEDDIANDAVRLRQRRIGKPEQQIGLPGDPTEIVEQRFVDAALRFGVYAVDGVHEEVQ